jgi:hypothetical protein
MAAMDDAQYYRVQAQRCLRLAKASEPHEAGLLNDLARKYEANARGLCGRK